MKQSTRWIIGIATALITVVGLKAAFGSRHGMHREWYNRHSCSQEKKAAGNQPADTVPGSDSPTRR